MFLLLLITFGVLLLHVALSISQNIDCQKANAISCASQGRLHDIRLVKFRYIM